MSNAPGTGEAVLFWILGPLAVLGSLGLIFAKKAVHAALGMALTMIILGIFYIAQDAHFLGVIQVFVYTGAVMMLFLFVLMLVGVDSSDGLLENLGRYVWVFEVTSALLITAALGAMVLAHRERLGKGRNQRDWSKRRVLRGEYVAGLPAPGVYARHNAVDTPALLPDGTPTPLSVSRVLTARDQVTTPERYVEAEDRIAGQIEEDSSR